MEGFILSSRNLARFFVFLGLAIVFVCQTDDFALAQTTPTQENIISGTVTDTAKTPKPVIARAVRLIAKDGSLVGFAITDSTGTYRLTGVKPGTYTLFVPDEMEYIKRKWVIKTIPRTVTVDSEVNFSQNIPLTVKAPTKVPLVEIRVMDPNTPGVPISGAGVQYKPVVGTKAKAVKIVTPSTQSKLKPGCYTFTATKLIGYYLPENQTSRLVCFDQYGPTGGGEGYQVVFFQPRIEDSRCDKVSQTGIEDFWYCGKKSRDTLATSHPQYAGYVVLWKRIVTKLTELRTAFGPVNTPEQVSVQSDRFGMDYVQKRLISQISTTAASCPQLRTAAPPTNGIPNPDEAERIAFSIDSFGYPMTDTAKKALQPQYQKQVDAQIAYLFGYTRDWRAGGCKNFASRDANSQINKLYTSLRANYPNEMDDALNLNRYLGSGQTGVYPATLRTDDPSEIYASSFAVGTIMKAEFDANIKEGLNNHNSIKYKAGASDALKTFMTEVLKKQ